MKNQYTKIFQILGLDHNEAEDLLSQPNDVLPGNSPDPTHLIGRDSFGPQSPVDRLRIDPEFLRQLADGEIIVFHQLISSLTLPEPSERPPHTSEGLFYSARSNDLPFPHVLTLTFKDTLL